MKNTLAPYWKSLFSKIHPPLPLTPQASLRLLNVLNASFRQHLDEQHPTKEGHYTNYHMQSILNSPLLVNSPIAPQNVIEGSVKAGLISAPLKEKAKPEPVKIMQAYISQGKATLETMKRCLLAQWRKSTITLDTKASMKDSKAGSITMHWLWSSGMLNTLNFLVDHSFTQYLIRFLVAEGRSHIIHRWLNQDYKKLQKIMTTDDSKKIPGRIILELIRAEIMLGNGSGSAFSIFTKLLDDWQSAGEKPKSIRNTFSPSGSYLIKMMESQIKSGTPLTDDYDSFQKAAHIWSKEDSYERAWLALHHPIHPEANLTTLYLRNLDSKVMDAMSKRQRTGIVDLALKAAERSLSQNNRTDMARIMEILKTHFPIEIGHEVGAGSSSLLGVKDEQPPERINVQLLEALAVG